MYIAYSILIRCNFRITTISKQSYAIASARGIIFAAVPRGRD